MASLLEQSQLAVNQNFASRCMMARVETAVYYLTVGRGSASDAAIRYAEIVFMRPLEYPERITAAVVTDPAIADAEVSGTGATDAAILERVQLMWLYLA